MSNNSSNLDALRTMAVLFVVISHLPMGALFLDSPNFHLQALGILGVIIFFVHTSLVLTYSLSRQYEKTGGYRIAQVFLIRRAFRIYPLSIFMICAVATLSYIFYGEVIDWKLFLSNILLIQNISGQDSYLGVLWSLPYEIQMYLFLPFIYLLVIKNHSVAKYIVILLWFIAVISAIILYFLKINYNLVKYFPCFIPGVLAFTLSNVKKNAGPELLFATVLFFALIYPFLVAIGYKENLLSWPICLIIGLIIPICSNIKSQLINRATKEIAKYSYGIYLTHGPMVKICFGEVSILNFILFISATAFSSFLLYHILEKPFINLGIKLSNTLLKSRLLRNNLNQPLLYH